MKIFKITILFLLLTTTFFSCTSVRNTNFAKVKYLDKQTVKKQKIKKQEEEIFSKIVQETVINTISAHEEYEASIQQELLTKTEIRTSISSVDQNNITSDYQENIYTTNSPEQIYSEIITNNKNRVKNKFSVKKQEAQQVEPIVKIILAFLIPPLAVFLHRGLDNYFWISLILTIFFWVPGVVFSLLVVLDVI